MSILRHSSHKSMCDRAMSASGDQEGSSCGSLARRRGPELTCPVPCRRRRPAGRLRGLLPRLMQLPRQRTRGREADPGLFAQGLFPLLPHSGGGGSVTSEPAHGSSDAFTSCQACRINVCHRGIVFPQQLISTGGQKKKKKVLSSVVDP